MGIAAPPERPKMYSTPSLSRHWTIFSPPVGIFWAIFGLLGCVQVEH